MRMATFVPAASAVGALLAGAVPVIASGKASSAQAASVRESRRERRYGGMGPARVIGGTPHARMGYPSRG